MISETLQILFFVIDNVFGELFWIFFGFLMVIGIFFAVVWEAVKR